MGIYVGLVGLHGQYWFDHIILYVRSNLMLVYVNDSFHYSIPDFKYSPSVGYRKTALLWGLFAIKQVTLPSGQCDSANVLSGHTVL
jgi:hypothetical protein